MHAKIPLSRPLWQITNGDITQATGAHFSMSGHSLADFLSTIIEQPKKKNSE